jgi:proteic killer suppression protein
MDIFDVSISKKVERELIRLPKHIALNLMDWVDDVKEYGLREVKKMPGYHDEPVKGKERKGQRSIRLNKAYRAFYVLDQSGTVHFVEIIEVNKHEY